LKVVDGHVGIVDEAKQRVAVVLVVADRDGERLRRQERWLDGEEPALEASACRVF
jgi:hypothetical protein